MSDASYYHDAYKEKKAEAKALEKNIRDLNKIASSFEESLNDKARAVNQETADLEKSISNAVRHNASFDSLKRSVRDADESHTLADAALGASYSALQREIRNLETKKSRAERDRDDYYQRYQDAKEESGGWFFSF